MCVYVCVFAVACSTVTVTKCQAALRTLQAFPFFRPTCLCREPHVDPECNSFRDFLFDHPCIYVNKKGELVSECGNEKKTARGESETPAAHLRRQPAPHSRPTNCITCLFCVFFRIRHALCSQSRKLLKSLCENTEKF